MLWRYQPLLSWLRINLAIDINGITYTPIQGYLGTLLVTIRL